MNCPESLDFLQQHLDGDPAYCAHPPDLLRHLSECRRCRELHAAALRLTEGLRLMPCPQPTHEFSRRITIKALTDRARRTLRKALAAALAAGVLLAFVLYSRRPSNRPAPASPHEEVHDVISNRPPTVPVNESALEVGQAFVSLAQRAAGDTVGQSRLLIPLVLPSDSLSPSAEALLSWEQPANSLGALKTGVSKGLEPVRTSAQRALNLFLREVPSIDPQRRTG